MSATRLSATQLSNWFINARRRVTKQALTHGASPSESSEHDLDDEHASDDVT